MFCGINFAFAQSSTLDLTGTNSSETAAANGAQSPEAIRELVSQLFDEEVQALLLDGLDAVADEQDESSTALTSNAFAFIKNWGLSVFKSSADAIIKFPQLLATQANSIFSLRFCSVFLLNGLSEISQANGHTRMTHQSIQTLLKNLLNFSA